MIFVHNIPSRQFNPSSQYAAASPFAQVFIPSSTDLLLEAAAAAMIMAVMPPHPRSDGRRAGGQWAAGVMDEVWSLLEFTPAPTCVTESSFNESRADGSALTALPNTDRPPHCPEPQQISKCAVVLPESKREMWHPDALQEAETSGTRKHRHQGGARLSCVQETKATTRETCYRK